MEINGIPLHPLVVHAVVVFTPFAGLFAILYGLVPRWRWVLRWPFLFTAVVGAVATYVAALTGSDLKHKLGIHGSLIETHETWAGRLEWAMWVLMGAAIIAAYVLPFSTPLRNATDKPARVGVLTVPLTVVLPLAGLVVMLFVYKTGDAGARMVWSGS